MTVRMEWRGDEVARESRERAAAGLVEAATQYQMLVEKLTPVRTGRLRSGWGVQADPGETRVLIVNMTPYAGLVESGTGRFPGRWMATQALEQFAPRFAGVLAAAMRGGSV